MKIYLHKHRYWLLIFILITGFSIPESFAGIVRNWTGTSANHFWSSASNWSPAGIPQTGDKLQFDSAHWSQVYIDVNPAILARITILSGDISFAAYGTFRQIVLSSSDTALYVSSTAYGTFALSSGSLSLGLSFSGIGNKVIDRGNLYVGNNCTYDATNSSTLIYGSMTAGNGQGSSILTNIISTASTLSFAAGASFDNNIGGNAIPTASWDIASTCTLSTPTLSGLGQAFGNFSISLKEAGNIALKGRLGNIRGNLTLSSFYPSATFSFGTDSTFTMNIGGNLIMNDFIVNGSYPVHYVRLTDGTASPTINIGGSLTKGNGNTVQIDFGSGSGAATLNIKGDFSNQGNYVTRTGSTSYGRVYFNGTNQLLTCDSSDRISYVVSGGSHVTLSGSHGSMVLNKSVAAFSGSMSVSSGATLSCGLINIVSISPGSNFNTSFFLYTGGTLEIGSASGITSTAAAGNIQTNFRSYSTAGNYTFNSPYAQVTGLDATTVNNLTIMTLKGVTLSNRLSVAGAVTIESNYWLNTGATNMLIINNGANFNNDGGYINGPMQKVGTQAFIFPVGSYPFQGVPIGISAPPQATDTFTAQYIHSSAAALGNVTAINLSTVSPCDYWTLYHHGPVAPTINVTGYWNSFNSACYNITDPSLMALAHLALVFGGGNNWNAYGKNVITGTATNGSVTWNGVSGFGTFALGKTFSARRTMAVESLAKDPGIVTAWPVPSTGLIHIGGNSLKDTNPVVQAQISNASGQLVQTINMENKAETTTTLKQAGIYLLTLLNKDGSIRQTKRIVIGH